MATNYFNILANVFWGDLAPSSQTVRTNPLRSEANHKKNNLNIATIIFIYSQIYFSLMISPRNFYHFLIKLCANRTVRIRHQSTKTIIFSCHRYLIKTGAEKNELPLNIDQNFDHQMSLSKSKCRYSNNGKELTVNRALGGSIYPG